MRQAALALSRFGEPCSKIYPYSIVKEPYVRIARPYRPTSPLPDPMVHTTPITSRVTYYTTFPSTLSTILRQKNRNFQKFFPAPHRPPQPIAPPSVTPLQPRRLGLIGVGPTTSPLSGARSSQLSYRPAIFQNLLDGSAIPKPPMETSGFEPPTCWLQTSRSPN